MKFQDSSFNGLKVTVGTKSVTHPRTHAPKAICPINFFKVGDIIIIKYHQICTLSLLLVSNRTALCFIRFSVRIFQAALR